MRLPRPADLIPRYARDRLPLPPSPLTERGNEKAAYAENLHPTVDLFWPQDGQGSGGDQAPLLALRATLPDGAAGSARKLHLAWGEQPQRRWGRLMRALGSDLRPAYWLAAGMPGFGRGTVLLAPLDKPSAARLGRSGLTSG